MNLIRKVLRSAVGIITAASIAVSSFVFTASAESFQTAGEAMDSVTVGINLGNALDSCGTWISGDSSKFETAWGNPVTTKSMITTMKNAGFNTVRVPVTWYQHIDEKGNVDEEWMDRVQEVVDYVISQELYCVLNVHHDGGTDAWVVASEKSYDENKARFAGLWKNIAERFKNYGNKLIFESFNEVLDEHESWTEARSDGAYKAINKYNQLFVDTVRATGGNNAKRNLMLQTYSGSLTEKVLSKFVLPTDKVKDHLIVQVHYYEPQGFIFNDATWTKMTSEWGSASDKKAVDIVAERLSKYSEKLGVPFIIGEFAAEDKNNNSAREAYAEYIVSKMKEKGINCIWWDTGGMALIDRRGNKVKFPTIVKALVKGVGTKADSSSSTDNKTEGKTEKTKAAKPKLTAAVNGSRVNLTWTKVDGATKYRVYRYQNGKLVKLKSTTAQKYTLKGLKTGKSYSFAVRAYVNGKWTSVKKADIVTVKGK